MVLGGTSLSVPPSASENDSFDPTARFAPGFAPSGWRSARTLGVFKGGCEPALCRWVESAFRFRRYRCQGTSLCHLNPIFRLHLDLHVQQRGWNEYTHVVRSSDKAKAIMYTVRRQLAASLVAAASFALVFGQCAGPSAKLVRSDSMHPTHHFQRTLGTMNKGRRKWSLGLASQ